MTLSPIGRRGKGWAPDAAGQDSEAAGRGVGGAIGRGVSRALEPTGMAGAGLECGARGWNGEGRSPAGAQQRAESGACMGRGVSDRGRACAGEGRGL